ncbi:hypothetical protein BDB01DRAFT_900509 [Pilobolus umbonatus]|nr:hypothetical protein BDB01DRAFT_900509 [Pilobolus umbonatus]
MDIYFPTDGWKSTGQVMSVYLCHYPTAQTILKQSILFHQRHTFKKIKTMFTIRRKLFTVKTSLDLMEMHIAMLSTSTSVRNRNSSFSGDNSMRADNVSYFGYVELIETTSTVSPLPGTRIKISKSIYHIDYGLTVVTNHSSVIMV